MPDKPSCSVYDPDDSFLGDSFVNLIPIFQLTDREAWTALPAGELLAAPHI
jgi:hypothetical protein